MPAIERLAMIQSQIELDQRRYIPSFPYMSREERAKYDSEKFYKRTFNKLPPSPLLVHSGVPYQHQNQMSLHQTSARRSPSPILTSSSSSPSSPRIYSPTPIISRNISPDSTQKDQNLNLDGFVKSLNKEKILCINKNLERIEINDDITVLQENINDISEEKFADDYDLIILNELSQRANEELSVYLKSIHDNVIIVIRDDKKPNMNDENTCQYDYYIDLNNMVSYAPQNDKLNV